MEQEQEMLVDTCVQHPNIKFIYCYQASKQPSLPALKSMLQAERMGHVEILDTNMAFGALEE
jgi:hypothetical protein